VYVTCVVTLLYMVIIIGYYNNAIPLTILLNQNISIMSMS